MNWLIGHLLGDYIFQNDRMAAGKKQSTLICLWHVAIYTLCIYFMTGWPWLALAVVAATHFAQDRTQLIPWLMRRVLMQKAFLENLGPWSAIVVDNVLHLTLLYGVDCYLRR